MIKPIMGPRVSNAPWAIGLMFVLVLGSGCSAPALSRSTATDKLEVMANEQQWVAEFGARGTIGADGVHNVGNADALWIYLLQADLVSDTGSSMCPIRLTDAGSREYTLSHWKCQGSDTSCGERGAWASCAIPVTDKLEIEVTGIRFDDATHAVVEYTVTGVPSRWGQALHEVTQMSGGLPVIFLNMMEPQHGKAAFALYDDGWRIANVGQ